MKAGFMAPAPGASPAPHDDALDRRILREQADSLLSTSMAASVGAFITALGFWGIFYYQTRQPAVLVWAALLHVTQAVRFEGNRRYLKTPKAQRDPERAARWYCKALTFNALAWGAAPWFFFPTNNLPLMSLMMLILLGMSSGGVASLAPYRPALFRFIVPVLAGLAAALLWQRDAIHIFLAVCTLAYLYVNLKFGLQQNRLLTEALRARYEKEDLAQRLAEQVRMVERASLEKTRFFASASHDLRQPLHSLGLFGSAIAARLAGTPDEPLARNMMHCVDALEASFSSMLDVSKLDAGVVDVKPEPVALAGVFKRLQASLGRQAEAQGLALRFKPGSKWVLADAALLERMLGNLVHNALKFTQQGGVAVVARTRGAQVSVEVWDSGRGIEAREVPRIFDEFYQVGNLERDRSKGLGMGLAIVRRIAGLLNVPVQVQSRPARGTVFKLLLPRADLQASAPPPQAGMSRARAPWAMGSLRVLVVDDEETVRTSTAAALRLYGLQVDVADGLQQARDIAARLGDGLAALITDFRLRNEEDGIEVATQLRALLGRDVPVLLVTGDTAPERVRQARQSGLRVLYKPVRVQDLVDALGEQVAAGKITGKITGKGAEEEVAGLTPVAGEEGAGVRSL
ncbi:MAG: hybrid sensor histidine kinase/response regulator [Polaromonas sp. 28-63-22]|nr:MAG: hybrid sensor histidine kinase/response regulator [Polaromonas sp. 28-63-22]